MSVVTILSTELKALQRIRACKKGQVRWGQGREENGGVGGHGRCVLGSLPRSVWTLAVPNPVLSLDLASSLQGAGVTQGWS